MDNEFGLNYAEIQRNFDHAEVISVYFPLLAKTLVMDLRTRPGVEPMIKVMPMVGSLEERYRSLRRLRPQFEQPEAISFVPWPKYVDALVRLGLWDRLTTRLKAGGYHRSLSEADEALDELRQLERSTMSGAILGRGFKTLWSRAD
jgi:hypothetical protein